LARLHFCDVPAESDSKVLELTFADHVEADGAREPVNDIETPRSR
jgi:hypothetical protein